MRILIPAAALVLLASQPTPAPAQAVPVPSPPTQPAPPTAPVQAAPLRSAPPFAASARGASRSRQTLADRFDQVNTSRDGHLTMAQASAARWSYMTRNFDAIDKDRRGFVTIDDIRAYARDQRAVRAQQAPRNATSQSRG